MATTVIGTFPTRREVEIAVEHLVQDHGLERTDIFVQPAADENSAGETIVGADAESGHPGADTDAEGAAYNGPLTVSVDLNEDRQQVVEQAFREAGATDIRNA